MNYETKNKTWYTVRVFHFSILLRRNTLWVHKYDLPPSTSIQHVFFPIEYSIHDVVSALTDFFLPGFTSILNWKVGFLAISVCAHPIWNFLVLLWLLYLACPVVHVLQLLLCSNPKFYSYLVYCGLESILLRWNWVFTLPNFWKKYTGQYYSHI